MYLMENFFTFNIIEKDGSITQRTIQVEKLCFSRHASRDIVAVRDVLDKKRAEGYSVHGNPSICRISRYLLTQEEEIEVQGPNTSGEVEFVLIIDKDEILVSVGSDHNDRSLESLCGKDLGKVYDSVKSKQMAPAIVAKEAWRYDDLKEHWDELKLKSFITILGKRITYQDFTLDKLLNPTYYFSRVGIEKEDGLFLFGGTHPALQSVPSNVYRFQPSINGLIFPQDFNFEIQDQKNKRKISHSYTVKHIEEQP
jgi:hypothetical protein